MRIHAYGSVLLLAVLAVPASAQEVLDSTRAERYFPLHVGNVWEYEGVSGLDNSPVYERRSIVKDTTIYGRRYVRYEQEELNAEGKVLALRSASYLRFDDIVSEIRRGSPGDIPPYDVLSDLPLDLNFFSLTEVEGCELVVTGGFDRDLLVGNEIVQTTVKTIDTQNCEVQSTFAAGIGLASVRTAMASYDLRYALVEGTEFGTTVGTAVAAPPTAASHPVLTVFPNPTRGDASVRLYLDAAQSVRLFLYDALGRRVSVQELGQQRAGATTHTLDTTTLPAGRYVIQLDGDKKATTSIQIVH